MSDFDVVIRGATVIDGTRAPRFGADIGISGGKIAQVGRLRGRARVELDGSGKIAAPGFIDCHTHDDRLMLSSPDMSPKVSQGVTTVIAGNCGISLAPAPKGMPKPVIPPIDLMDDEGTWFRFPTFSSYVKELEAKPAATNCALLVGHSMLRVQAMAGLDRPASSMEIDRMRSMVSEAMEAGAIGVSTGLYYEPARAATTEEVIEVCRPLTAKKGLYVTHMRDEGDRVTQSLEETFRIGREVGVPVVVSHHKVVGKSNHGRSPETLALIERAMKSQRIGLDCYPYCASSTILSVGRLAPATKVLVTWSKPHPEFAGMDLNDIAQKLGVTPEKAVEHLVPAGAIYFSMDEQDVQRILKFDQTMIGSAQALGGAGGAPATGFGTSSGGTSAAAGNGGSPSLLAAATLPGTPNFGGGSPGSGPGAEADGSGGIEVGGATLPHDASPHPRLWGTFPRVLGHYARGLGLFPLETAIHKMTGLTARTFGLAERGLLRPGYAADVVLFSEKGIEEAATFEKPIAPAKGIEAVLVNGQLVWKEGKPTGARPGKVLRRIP